MTTSNHLRETVARIIDPWAFSDATLGYRGHGEDVDKGQARRKALAKADAIRALTAPPSVADQGAGFYVASRASLPERPARWRHWRDQGVKINSTWIDEAGEGETGDFGELWSRIEREIKMSAALVLWIEPDDFPLKGALVEVGMALAAGVPVRIVAPRVPLTGLTFRPIGSWIKHPLVSFHPNLGAAFNA